MNGLRGIQSATQINYFLEFNVKIVLYYYQRQSEFEK